MKRDSATAGTRILTWTALVLLVGPFGGMATGQTLQGTAWNAVEVVGTAVTVTDPDRRPHLAFGTDGRVSGSDGCNRLSGPYVEKGEALTFGALAATMMACPESEQVAQRFRSALKGTGHFRIVKGRLEFVGATGKPLVVFEPRQTAASGPPALQGTWQLVRFEGGDGRILTPVDRSRHTIEFGAGGRLAARVDCNSGRGSWKATPPSQLEFGPLALTRAKCRDGSLHDQIARQWTSVRSFVIRNGHLFLSLMADGGIYEFEPLTIATPR